MYHRVQYLARSYFYAILMTPHPWSHLMFDSLLTTASFIGPYNLRTIKKKLQEDLTKLERWADIWGMKFNPSKCSVLRVKRPRAKEIASDYQLKGVTLAKVSNSPYLGVSIITSPKLRVRLIPTGFLEKL